MSRRLAPSIFVVVDPYAFRRAYGGAVFHITDETGLQAASPDTAWGSAMCGYSGAPASRPWVGAPIQNREYEPRTLCLTCARRYRNRPRPPDGYAELRAADGTRYYIPVYLV